MAMGKKLNEEEQIKIRKNIVKRLYSKQAFCNGHLLFERLKMGIPLHLHGFVRDELEKLIKEEIVLYYGKTKHGDAYQLNIKKIKEIEEIIFNHPSS